jgi:predicted MPP superfamily phosphohydrolase
MAEIRILHMSDLHAGMAEHRDRFQHLRTPILNDLREQVAGQPVHILAFTGDLTQRGTEFDAFQHELTIILDAMETWTSARPLVLAVPGNHDLVRPDASDGMLTTTLDGWEANETLRERFWSSDTHGLRKTVDVAFANYNAWWTAHLAGLRTSVQANHGVMPGDFSASVNVGDVRIGVVGLNSAFLQLADNRGVGSLDVDITQLNRVVPGEVDAWLSTHDLTLLLTHHPTSWLCRRGQETFDGWIARADRFDAHLFGHMHKSETKLLDELGLKRPAAIQAPSLFGVERLRKQGVDRSVGYSLLRFDTVTRIWQLVPRLGTKVGPGLYMNPDTRFALRESRWVEFSSYRDRQTATSATPRAGLSIVGATREMELPGGPYNEHQYVARPTIEATALKMLASIGRPAVLCGTHGTGKTWMLSHLLGRWKAEHVNARIVYVPFGEFDTYALTNLDHFVWRFAGVVADQLSVAEELVDLLDPNRPQRLAAMMRLRKFFEEAALKLPDPLVLMLDDADRLREHPYRQDFYAGLRAWMDRATGSPMERLRLLIAIAVPATRLIEGDGRRSIFNLTIPLDLSPFSEEQVVEVARRCNVLVTDRVARDLLAQTGGVPAEVIRGLYDLRYAQVTAAPWR